MTNDGGREVDDGRGEVDDEADPFSEIETEVDDPFAELGEGVDGSESDDAEPIAPDSDEPDPKRDELAAGDALFGDTEEGLGEAFERMDVGGVADEDVWESIDEDATDEPFDPGAAEPWDTGSGETEHVVDKRTYCQQCPHFSAPPEVACTHEGTTIVEMVGFDEFRVRNCPMVSEDDPTFDADR